MDMNKLREAASRIWNAETLPALKTFVSRESLSTDFDPEWEKHGILNEVCREAAAWGTRMLPRGTYDVQQEPGRTPALIFSVPGTDFMPAAKRIRFSSTVTWISSRPRPAGAKGSAPLRLSSATGSSTAAAARTTAIRFTRRSPRSAPWRMPAFRTPERSA